MLNMENVIEKEESISKILSTKVSKLLYCNYWQVELSISDEKNENNNFI